MPGLHNSFDLIDMNGWLVVEPACEPSQPRPRGPGECGWFEGSPTHLLLGKQGNVGTESNSCSSTAWHLPPVDQRFDFIIQGEVFFFKYLPTDCQGTFLWMDIGHHLAVMTLHDHGPWTGHAKISKKCSFTPLQCYLHRYKGQLHPLSGLLPCYDLVLQWSRLQ